MAMVELSMAARAAIADIANRLLNLEPLSCPAVAEPELYEVSVCQLRAALEAAYLAGMVDHYRRK
ncbi:hypothetical protein HMPREF3069_20860 [Achromobacter xylosoxidans]|jgi:hypothetical protein|uniref:DUF6900 domain-containing protein n=1 Tax=Alcaligenes xylosoxydans xylosoxydans TaxID=85698 RepID=A0A9X3KWQ1_ALCXX|nr:MULTISPECIES: hypothetical protein [Achromobacter]MCP2518449.1 hypothetical protein [Achromobacter mucicolens]MCZ8401379.1 hypothetical protein [Achromobacter xylosoxidans]MDH0519731.1 hypothetical protein [Achromobacter xylosoxidans]MDH0544641.1 hypothetical protein [Achromobacter xylosoxidans]OAE61642.1 hypothetical protein A7J71_09990 [Achromobacter insolitus]